MYSESFTPPSGHVDDGAGGGVTDEPEDEPVTTTPLLMAVVTSAGILAVVTAGFPTVFKEKVGILPKREGLADVFPAIIPTRPVCAAFAS